MPRNPPPNEDKPLPPPPPPPKKLDYSTSSFIYHKYPLIEINTNPYYPIPPPAYYPTHKMTMHDFVYWLRGYFELENPSSLNENQVKIIKEHLDSVFVDDNTPKYYGSC